MRITLAIVSALAFVAGCSLLVDAGGLSTASESGSPDGSSAADGGNVGSNDGSSPPNDAGSDGNVDANTFVPDGTCPKDAGAPMVRINDIHGTFCIDKTEVTNRHLNAFIASSSRPSAPSACASKSSYGGSMRPDDDLPATQVDWCDAWMYCKWAGKRLCGSREGTPIIDLPQANDAKISEWFAACSKSGTQQYPYAGNFMASACNGCQRTNNCNDGGSPLLPVGSLATCEGGYEGVFDLSGNVAEWEDNCDADNTCPPRGGSSAVGGADLTCAMANIPNIDKRSEKGDRVGIRCCAD